MSGEYQKAEAVQDAGIMALSRLHELHRLAIRGGGFFPPGEFREIFRNAEAAWDLKVEKARVYDQQLEDARLAVEATAARFCEVLHLKGTLPY